MKIEIKNRYTDKVIFEYSKGGATLKETVEFAVKSRVSLRGADLRGAYLSGADLSDVDLRGADLRGADLSRANLSRANLSRANLSRANLSDADLCRAYLRDAILSRAILHEANLESCMGNQKEIMTMQVDTCPISFTKQDLQIGCKRFTHDEWRNFTDREISNFDNGSLVWWKKWKDFIFLAITLSFGKEK